MAKSTKKQENGGVLKTTVTIPKLEQGRFRMKLIGDSPLLVNNKLSIAKELSDTYSGSGKTGRPKRLPATPDEQYARAFYVMADSKHPAPHPKGRYGIPTSGIYKCLCKAIRQTGITNNTEIGVIGGSFRVIGGPQGLSEIQFDRLERDERPVNIGSGQKTVPQMRYRPMFHGWSVVVDIVFNRLVISPEQIVNLAMHAGQYVGLCEMRAEKKQGECGGFYVETASVN